MANSFYTKENLKLMVSIFKDYMVETFSFNIKTDEDEATARKLLYDLMNKINDECKDKQQIPLQAKNLRVMNIAKEIYRKKYNLNESQNQKKPNIQNLSRDKSIYGDRQLQTTVMVPEIEPYSRKNQSESKEVFIDKLISERDTDIGIEKKKKRKY
jgi:ABC-type phosphate transport system substrate-binding protein